MSTCRAAVEWSFGSVTKLWTALDFQNKALQSAVGLNYLVATLLHNAHGIFHPNEVSQYFQCRPPTLAEYHGKPTDGDCLVWSRHGIQIEDISASESGSELSDIDVDD